VKGPLDKLVEKVSRNSVDHPDIDQRDIQELIWAMLARAKFSDLQPHLKSIASQFLTPQDLAGLNNDALSMLTDNQIANSFIKEPPFLQQIYEAEARIRNTVTNPTASFGDVERIAIISGDAPMGPGSREIPSGRWSNHPDGYLIRYVPSGYSTTKVCIYVPAGSPAVGKEFDPALHVAVPGNTSRQRLLQSGRFQRLGS